MIEGDGPSLPPVGEEAAWVLDAVKGISDALMIVDASPRLVFYNPAAVRLLRITSLTPDVRRWPSEIGLFLPDERTPLPYSKMALVRGLAGEEVRDMAVFIRSAAVPAGIHLLVSGAPLRDRSGTIRGSAVTFKDVTLARERDAKVREVERQRKAVLDNIPDIAWLKDERGRYLVVNHPFAKVAGRARPEDLVGCTDYDLWPEELARKYQADDAALVRGGPPFTKMEERLLDASGRLLWVETSKRLIIDDDGKVIGTTGISHDITDRKRAEEAMRSSKDELEARVRERTAELAEAQESLVRQERLAVLGQLAGGVAHQIRNPLAAIMNATYVLRRHLSPDQHPDVEDAIRIIHDEVRHANTIITGLLDYARMRTPDVQPTSVNDVIERVLASEWLPPNVELARDLPGEDVICDADPDQLQGAIANIIRNAVEAMPDGGELAVALGARDGEVVITISDTGTGISPQVRSHLFEPLHSTKPMGIGLGLVTARRFVETHGGRIACIDAPAGARFEIRLPASSAKEA